MKKLIPAYIIAFVSSFMLLIYEPIFMYSTNINEFKFEFKSMLAYNFKLFIIAFLVISLIFSLIYFLSKKVFKKDWIYNVSLVGSFILFVYLYIHGNFLLGNLPALDGATINWNNYTTMSIISLFILIILIFGGVVAIKNYEKYHINQTIGFVTLAIFIMLSTSLISVLTNEELYSYKSSRYATYDNLYKYSNDENFIIFLVDAVDSLTFQQELEHSQKHKEALNDFTYFPDTMSAYLYTRDSIPFIFSGKWNENKTTFQEYYNSSFNNSYLLKKLNEKNFDLNIYDIDFYWNEGQVENIKNIKKIESIDNIKLIKQEMKLILYKYLPFYLKKYSNINSIDFNNVFKKQENSFSWLDKDFYNNLKRPIKKQKSKQFKFIHLEGAHIPFWYDDELNYISNGTYNQMINSTIKTIDSYLKQLKKNDVYDNSTIIIMADHGYVENNKNDKDITLGRQNPILYIKGKNEKHKLIKSDSKVSFTDLNYIYKELIKGKKSEDLFKDNNNNNKDRRLLWYECTKEDHMIEYIQKGKAWDEKTLIPTGKEFNR